ncbi:MAG: hypothetical protein ACRD11_01060 [Terriglobia bacterium]
MSRRTIHLLLAASLAGICVAQPPPSGHQPVFTYLQIFCHQYSPHDATIPVSIRRLLSGPASQTFEDARGRVWQATPHGLAKVSPSGHRAVLTGKDGLPILSLKGITGGPDGRLWLATREGAICFVPDAPAGQRWFYFWGKRYLSSNQVVQIVAGRNEAWIRTGSGVSLIEFKPFTLAQKSEVFLKRLRRRHVRYGYVADCDLLRSGEPSSYRKATNDNDGLWTSIYLTSECFRYAATGSPQALQNARQSLAALLRLVSITGIPGFPARSLIHRGDYLPPGGEWHWTPDGQWEWKGDTSSDELVGHFYAYWVAYHLLPANGDRAAIRGAVASIAGGLLKHRLTLVGYGGRVTTWGRYNPAYFKTAKGRDDAALDSLEILSHLRVAYQITGDPKFLTAYQRIGSKLGYVENVMQIGGVRSEVNYSDEELAFLSFYPLLQAEDNPALRRKYQEALTRLWQRVRAENNPLWDFIYSVSTGAKHYDCADAMTTLQRIPMSTVRWTVKNSQRVDLPTVPQRGRQGERQAREAISPDERYVMKWNSDPFQLDGGQAGRSEDDGAFFLLPYWFGRYYHLLACPR